ncbi:MAG: DNA polymerase III subunit delta [Pseudomonadota bacterium]
MKIAIDRLAASLEGSLAPIYLVTGDEPLLVSEARDLIVASAKQRGWQQRELFVADSGFSWDDLYASTQSLGLFAEHRLIDLRLPTGKPGEKGGKIIAELAATPPELTLIVITAPKLSGSAMNAKWVKSVDAAGGVVRVWPLQAKDLPRWLEARLDAVGLRAERDAVLQMARRVEGNLLAAKQEIDKLALLHPGETLNAQQIADAMGASARFDVFTLADEVLAGRTQRALRMLENLRVEGVVPVLVLWSVVREVRTMAALRESMDAGQSFAGAAGRARVWKNRQSLVRAALDRHDAASLRELIALSAKADAASKGRDRNDPWQLLTEIIYRLATGRALMGAA